MTGKAVKVGAIYSRVSVDDGVENGSPVQQEHMGKQLAEMLTRRSHDGTTYRIKYVLTEPKGVSGGTKNRPKYRELLSLIESRKIDFVVAKEISRLSRSTKDFCDFISLCKANKVSVHVQGLDLDPNNPMNEMMFNLFAVLAEFERKMIIRRVKDSVRSSMLNNGKINGGTLPLGFDRNPKRTGYWLPNPKELDSVEVLMKTFVETGSIKETLAEADRLNIRNKKGNPFQATSLRCLLNNQKYVGKLVVRFGDLDERIEVVDLEHGPVVSTELFARVQERLQKREENSPFKNRHGVRIYTLTGLLRATDGTPFSGQSGKGRSGQRYIYYWNAKNKLRIDAADIESKVIEVLRKSFEKNQELGKIVRELKGAHTSKMNFVKQQEAQVRSEVRKIDQEESSLMGKFTSLAGEAEAPQALKWLEGQVSKLSEAKQKLQDQLDSLRREREHLERTEVTQGNTRTGLERTFARLQSADPARQRGFLREIFHVIEVQKDNLIKLVWSIPDSGPITGGKKVAAENEWWALRDLNPRHSRYERGTLTS